MHGHAMNLPGRHEMLADGEEGDWILVDGEEGGIASRVGHIFEQGLLDAEPLG